MPAFGDLNEKTALRIGAQSGKPSFLLWGDSHAEAFAPAVDARAKASGKTGLYIEYSGCLPLIGVARLDHSARNAPCEEVGGKVLTLLEHFRIKHIILAGRWDDVFGWEEGSIEMGRPEPIIAFTMRNGQQITHGEAFAPSLKETVETLRAHDIHVWIIEQVPPYLFDVPTGLSKAAYFGRNLKDLERPYSEIEARRKTTNEAFAPLRSVPGVSFIDPADTICPGKTVCLVTHEKQTLYRDNNHLSVYGSLWSQEIFSPVFGGL
jgi:hypothetical protein